MAGAAGTPGRAWGWTTRVKLEVLEQYLSAFTTACSKKSREIVYIDLFAGVPSNTERDTDQELVGSAELALRAEPPFTRLRYVEMPHKARALEGKLRDLYPGRDVQVVGGDCNAVIDELLTGLQPWEWAPTFAFIDPDGMEVAWQTIEALAAHKKRSRTKVELWILFPAAGLMRTMALDARKVTEASYRRMDRLFGCSTWEHIYNARRRNEISGTEAREEYVNLMRVLLHGLGYQHTHAIELRARHGSPNYHMVFASDSDAGEKIMRHLYRQAFDAYPEMRAALAAEREDASGVLRLFDTPTDRTAAPVYEPTETWEPLGWGQPDPEPPDWDAFDEDDHEPVADPTYPWDDHPL